MNTYYWTCGSGLVELELTAEDAGIGSHPGPCDADVAYLRTIPRSQALRSYFLTED